MKRATAKVNGIGDNGNGRGDPVKYRIAVNSEIKFKADLKTDKRAAKSLTYNYTLLDLTLEELAEMLRERCNITSVCVDDNARFHRKAENFRASWFAGVDIDNDRQEYFSLEDALAHPFIKEHGGIVYTTASHTLGHHKFRILFFFEEEIKDRQRFEQIVAALIWLFKSDEACKDVARFFYGAGENGQVIVLGNEFPNKAIDELLKEHETALAPKRKQQAQRAADSVSTFKAGHNTAQDRGQMYAQQAIDTAVKIIYDSYPPKGKESGTRHKARRRAAYLLGGYVGGGLLSYDEARAALEDAVRANTDNFRAAMKTIDDCLSEGQSEPITLDDKEREWGQYVKQQTSKTSQQDQPFTLDSGEVIDPSHDPPVSNDPDIEKYLRSILANASRFTKARMWIAAALGFTKLPWRLLNAILAHERDKLSVKTISDDMLLGLYSQNGERLKSERTLRRDKKKLWTDQKRIGVELVWYLRGYIIKGETEEQDQKIASRYKSNLDRWALEAIDRALQVNGSRFYIKDVDLKKACLEVAKGVPRCQIEVEYKPPKREKRQRGAEDTLKRVAQQFLEEWDGQNLTLGERHNRARNVLTGFAEYLLRGADESQSPGSKLRKRRKKEATETAKNFVDSILEEVTPINKRYLHRPKVSALSLTAVRMADENDLTKGGSTSGQNVRHRESDYLRAKSITYEKSAYFEHLELRREEIRCRWAEILRRSGCPFVDRSDSVEVIRLADELDELDRLASGAIPVDDFMYQAHGDAMEAIL